ncbi:hypothetical protein REPUB_Repub10bG0093400 [Reevesia pubescens]
MLKKGKYNVGKAISNLVFHHKVYDHLSSLSCKSNDALLSFISPREYEFSCNNNPAFYSFYAHHKRNKHHHFGKSSNNYRYDDVTTVATVQKVLEMLNNDAAVDASPMVVPGFGKSPMVRPLRVTNSPFSLKDEADTQVDKVAEEFINKFYKDLKLQKRNICL